MWHDLWHHKLLHITLVGINQFQDFKIASWPPISQIIDNFSNKLKYGIYINENGNNFMENLEETHVFSTGFCN
jgi:hypothetical protein